MNETSCSACSDHDERDTILVSAARHPNLKGSHFVGSRGVRDLFVCRQCGTMWQTWFDQREGYQCWRTHGQSIVPVFAADTSLARMIDWLASHYDTANFGLIDALAKKLIRRRPEGLRNGTAVLILAIGELTPPKYTTDAARISMLFHLLGLVVDRSIRGDLRPSGPRVKPPTRYRDHEVEEAARSFHPRSVDGITHWVRTHDLVRRLMWEDRWGLGPRSPNQAVVVIDDLSAACRFLEDLPLEAVDDGILRGVYADSAFKSMQKLHNLGRLPENDHAIWMPTDAWLALEKLLDPLERLAATFRRISTAASLIPKDLLQRIQMESILVKEPIRRGARFTDNARIRLEEIAQNLNAGHRQGRDLARDELNEILALEAAASENDHRCVIAQS